MANIRYDDLLQHVLPEVHGCSDPLAEQAIRDAAIEFCRRSRIWVVACDPADVTALEGAYDIDLPADSSLIQIASVRIAGQDLIDAASTDKLDEQCRHDWDTKTGYPRYYTQIDDESFLCTPIPDFTKPDGLLVRLIVKPSQSSTGYPNWINERYQEYIVAGAKARLMKKQGQPWYNPGQAASYESDYDSGIAVAADDSSNSLVRSRLRVTPHN